MTTPPLTTFYERYAPPFDVLRDLTELGELHGLRPRTLEWMKRVGELMREEPLPVQSEIVKEPVKYE